MYRESVSTDNGRSHYVLIKEMKRPVSLSTIHRRSQGVHVHPRAEKKIFFWGGGFTAGESCKCTPGRECTPEAEQEFIFLRKGSFSVCFESDD